MELQRVRRLASKEIVMSNRKWSIELFATILALLSIISFASAQTAERKEPTPCDPIDKNLKGRIFEVKHRDPDTIIDVIRPLASPSKEAMIKGNDQFRTISVRDYPENLTLMEEAIKRLDSPESSAYDIRLKIHLLIASKSEGLGNNVPSEVKRAIDQLEPSTDYKSFYYVSSIAQRLHEGFREARGKGTAELGIPLFKEIKSAGYEFRINSVSVSPVESHLNIKLGDFTFILRSAKEDLGEAMVKTDVSVKDGEQVVVGRASLKDKALILILVPTVVK
jgi:hypothetical protein